MIHLLKDVESGEIVGYTEKDGHPHEVLTAAVTALLKKDGFWDDPSFFNDGVTALSGEQFVAADLHASGEGFTLIPMPQNLDS